MFIVTLEQSPQEVLDWLIKNCPSYITTKSRTQEHTSIDGIVYVKYSIDFYFGDENDANWFLLRWS